MNKKISQKNHKNKNIYLLKDFKVSEQGMGCFIFSKQRMGNNENMKNIVDISRNERPTYIKKNLKYISSISFAL